LLPISIFDVNSCLIFLSSSTGKVPEKILFRYPINSQIRRYMVLVLKCSLRI